MKRSPLKRTTAMKRGGKIRPVNAKRRKANHARAYGGAERIAFVKSLPCIVKGREEWANPVRHDGPIEVMHTKSGGKGRKADARFTVPCCSYHHRNAHLFGAKSFELAYGLSLEAEAARVESLWQQQQEAA